MQKRNLTFLNLTYWLFDEGNLSKNPHQKKLITKLSKNNTGIISICEKLYGDIVGGDNINVGANVVVKKI